MVMRRVWLLAVAGAVTGGCMVGGAGEVPNGQNGELSFDLHQAVAAGSPFKVRLWVPLPETRCDPDFGCIPRVPMIAADLNCADSSVCEPVEREPDESADTSCNFIIHARSPGSTVLEAVIMTADGEMKRDRVRVDVVNPTGIRVDCQDCQGGALPGAGDHNVQCVAQHDGQDLRGNCEVSATGAGVELTPAGDDAHYHDVTDRGVAGNSFSAHVEPNASGTLQFFSGNLQQLLQVRPN